MAGGWAIHMGKEVSSDFSGLSMVYDSMMVYGFQRFSSVLSVVLATFLS